MAEPLIVACLRHGDQRPGIDPLTGAVRRDEHGAIASPADFAALELALRLADTWGGCVLAVVAGPPAAEATLREAMAAGADALRVAWPAPEYLTDLAGDERGWAQTVADAVRGQHPALVMCGDRSADRGTGAFPAFLAHELGAAQALGLVSLRADGEELLGERRLPAGRRERLRIPRPAVCSVEAAGLRLRRSPLAATRAAGQAVVPALTPVPPPPSPMLIGAARPYAPRPHRVPPAPAGSARERLSALSGVLSRHEPPAMIGPVDAGRAARELVDYLRRSGYVSQADSLTQGGSLPREGGQA
jgi:electron transfer flavoprotein beta subunit